LSARANATSLPAVKSVGWKMPRRTPSGSVALMARRALAPSCRQVRAHGEAFAGDAPRDGAELARRERRRLLDAAVQHAKQPFGSFDINKDGAVSKAEFLATHRSMFMQFNVDANQRIPMSELATAQSAAANQVMLDTTLWTVFPLAFLTGILFNLNPSSGSGTLLWTSAQKQPSRMALLAAIRIGVLALVGALAGSLGARRCCR